MSFADAKLELPPLFSSTSFQLTIGEDSFTSRDSEEDRRQSVEVFGPHEDWRGKTRVQRRRRKGKDKSTRSLTHHRSTRIESSEDPRVLGDVDRSTDGEEEEPDEGNGRKRVGN